MSLAKAEITRTLNCLVSGDTGAVGRLIPMVYDELRHTAARYFASEDRGHTLQPTALVHEAYLKLVDIKDISWRGRTHFYALGAKTMRRILVDHARSKASLKRGGTMERISLDEGLALSLDRTVDVLAVEEALITLHELDPRAAEIVEYRFFGGLTEAEIAEALSLSKRTIRAEWRMAKAWLRDHLSEGD